MRPRARTRASRPDRAKRPSTLPVASHHPSANRLLRLIPRDECVRLEPYLERQAVAKGQILFEQDSSSRHVYFVESGTVSLLSHGRRGEMIEVALVGSEGAAGVSLCLGGSRSLYRGRVQIAGTVLTLNLPACEGFLGDLTVFQQALLRYVNFLLAQVSQNALCNRFHSASERLARWLLSCRDRVDSDTLDMSQELLGQMLGTPRPWVTRLARELQDRDLIAYDRGQITIVDRQGLARAACECYGVMRQHLRELMAPERPLSSR